MTAKIIDPMPFFGVPSGIRELVVSPRERRTLLAAIAIVEAAHDLMTDALGDEHYDLEYNLCLVPDALRALADPRGIAV